MDYVDGYNVHVVHFMRDECNQTYCVNTFNRYKTRLDDTVFKSPTEALSSAIDYCIEIINYEKKRTE